MKVVIVHYHLNPGGVTRIIESQVKGLQIVAAGTELTLLCGNPVPDGIFQETRIQVDNSLNYWDPAMQEVDFMREAENLTAMIRNNLTDKGILHCHNPNLGKNPALTLAVFNLAAEGCSVVNHCHDFPEERPANMDLLDKLISGAVNMPLVEILYPNFTRYHYITLNSTDYKRIAAKGIPHSRIHLLPNPVSLSGKVKPADKPAMNKKIRDILGLRSSLKLCTYPVRGIERKNLGEFILLAALLADVAYFTITQAPKNPSELPRYNRWKNFCRERGIAVKFESGEEVNHEELISISDFCITTSIREGFGMVYLEPWLAGIPVVGRDLASVTVDLKQYGLEFPRLYERILIETDNGMEDFKDLDSDKQESVITDVLLHKSSGLKLFRDNPFLGDLLYDFPAETVLKNQKIVIDEFSLEKYGKELLTIYSEISQ